MTNSVMQLIVELGINVWLWSALEDQVQLWVGF